MALPSDPRIRPGADKTPDNRRTLVSQPSGPWRKALERWVRIIQGNFDHMDGVITQVQNRHNNLDDNVQELAEHVNDVISDLEQRIYDLENP